MADPRIRPVSTDRLPVPSAGVDGMRVIAASQANVSGGRNYSGNISPELGTISEVLGTIGPAVRTGADLAGMARTIDYQSTAQRNQAELQQRADALNISAGQFQGARNDYINSASQLTSLTSIANGYQQRAEQLAADQQRIIDRNAQIQTQSDALMQQLRTTRDRATQTQIRDQLTSLRTEAMNNNLTAGNNLAESQMLQANLTQITPQIQSASAQAEADRFLAQERSRELQNNIGQFGQSAQNAMNDQQSYANFMIGAQYGNMSGGALNTLSGGFADLSMGNYAAGTMGIGSAALNFSNVLAPSITPFASVIQAGAFATGLGIDTGSPMAGVDRFMQMTGTAGHFSGMLSSVSAFDRAYANNDFNGMVAASLGMTGNSLDFGAAMVQQTLGFLPEAQGIAAALRIGGATAELAGAATLNLAATNASFETQLSLGAANTILAMDAGSMGIIDMIGDGFQSLDNLFSDRGLNNPSSPTWQQGLGQLVGEGISERGEMVTLDPAAAYQNGLNNSLVIRNLDYSLLNPQPLTATNLIDGPSSMVSFPWSQNPINPNNPQTGEQTFTPSYQLPWNPSDPFNLNQYVPPPPVTPPNVPPDCPRQPPQSRGRGTGNPRGLPVGWRTA